MNDDVAAIDQHPFPGLLAFDAIYPAAMLLDPVHDVLCQRLGLPCGIGTGNRDVIKNGRKLGNVDEFDIARLNIFQRVDDDGRQLFGSQLKCSPVDGRACDAQYNRKRRQVLNREWIGDFSAGREYL